jgi:hypothetical protein
MTAMVRMGARATLGDDQQWSFGRATVEYAAVDDEGNEIARWQRDDDTAALVLELVHFVDLDDGRRVTTERLGSQTLATEREITVDELRDEIRETIYEDEIREIEVLADEPRWEELIEALGDAGVTVDAAALEALPFVVELDDEVTAALRA